MWRRKYYQIIRQPGATDDSIQSTASYQAKPRLNLSPLPANYHGSELIRGQSVNRVAAVRSSLPAHWQYSVLRSMLDKTS